MSHPDHLTRADLRNLAQSAAEAYLKDNDAKLKAFTVKRLKAQGINDEDTDTVIMMMDLLTVGKPRKKKEKGMTYV